MLSLFASNLGLQLPAAAALRASAPMMQAMAPPSIDTGVAGSVVPSR